MGTPEFGVLIADDEPAARRGVRQLLAPFPRFGIVGECRDGAETLAALDLSHPHVIFLDIQMPGLGGFDVIHRRSPARMPIVVFLTAFDQYALAAFEAQALDYLLKPVTAERFGRTIARVTRQLEAGGARAADSRAIVVTTSRGATVLPLDEIDWIEAEGNYARVWTGSRSYLLREPLASLEARVRAHGFLRAHRRALVRLSGVRRLEAKGAGESSVELACGARIPISRRRRPTFTSALRVLGTHR